MGEPHHEVVPAVLAQALGSALQPGEEVACAVHAKSSRGRMFTNAGGAQVAVVTDRRLVQVNGWIFGGPEDPAAGLWRSGKPLDKGHISRRYVWFGQIRDVEVDWRRSRLILHTSDGHRQELKLDGPSLVALDSAIGAGLDSPPPAVLDQALWWILGSYERVVCAAFVSFSMGPVLRCGADGAASPHLVVVSDRRLIKVIAWPGGRNAVSFGRPRTPPNQGLEPNEWERGEPPPGARMTRRYLWLGQIRRIEVATHAYRKTPRSPHAPRDKTLTLHTADGGQEMLEGGAEPIRRLESALREVLAGPGRDTPPQASSPLPRRAAG
jgi:hypothetical protein